MRKWFLKTLGVIVANLFFVQLMVGQNFQISGGNDQSVMICANGRVYAWGNNEAGPSHAKILGSRGTGSMAPIISIPEEVLLPIGITVQQVDAGSGSHVLALSCLGTVYAWGSNGHGQTGQPISSGVTTPVQVPTGEQGHASTFLSDVINVSGGNDESYAILSDGRVVAWGQNDVGQLGNGTTTGSVTPVFVRLVGGGFLSNVIQVEAGDETGYALVDPDGDGVGMIYSWGSNATSQLGRPAVNTSYAAPVVKANGDPLDGIVMVSAGDVHCLAIDTAGNVWAWGNGGWGGLTGTNANFGESHIDPRRVVGGETGEPYLNAIAISAGQGYSMAVTSDGHAVAWGNNGSTGGSGGALGNCATAGSPFPVYIRTNATTPITGIVNISDGDTWGFLIKDDNSFWTWGANHVGQLGIGGTTSQSCVVPFNPPTTCKVPDLEPFATLPPDYKKCLPFSDILDAGFPALPGYTYTWYKNGVVILGETGRTLTVTDVGTYTVEVTYVGTDAPCGGYDPAIDSITISEFETKFTAPSGLTACGSSFLNPFVNGDGTYHWYTDLVGGTRLDTSWGSDPASIHYLDVTDVQHDTIYTVYVEEAANVNTRAAKASEGLVVPTNASNPTTQDMELQIVLYEDVKFNSLKFYWKHGWSVGVANATINIYGQKTACGGQTSADRTNLIYAGPTITMNDPGDQLFEEVEVDMGGLILPGSPAGTIYWIGFQSYSIGAGVGILTGASFPYLDDATGGDILRVLKSDLGDCAVNAGQYGVFYDINVSTLPKACERIPVEIRATCPLPVSWLNFSAQTHEAGHLLTWVLTEEYNNSHFVAQVSTDGVHFEDIGTIPSRGNAIGNIHYNFVNQAPKTGINYYRIKQVDVDGTTTYSNIVTLNEAPLLVKAYPNPFQQGIYVQVGYADELINIEILDVTGRVVSSDRYNGGEIYHIGTQLSPGAYYLKVTFGNRQEVISVIKL
jgi:alpha-tubulin suppressor-like RCC1 family protein